MGLFDKLFGSSKSQNKAAQSKNADYSYIAEIAGLISSNDEELCENIGLTNPKQYFSENTLRFGLRGIDVNSADRDTLHWIGLVDELADRGFLFGVDYKCGLEDFLGALEQLKYFGLISKAVSELEFDENGDPESWGRQINEAVNGALVCWVDIDSDSYELIIVTAEAYEKITQIAQQHGKNIAKF